MPDPPPACLGDPWGIQSSPETGQWTQTSGNLIKGGSAARFHTYCKVQLWDPMRSVTSNNPSPLLRRRGPLTRPAALPGHGSDAPRAAAYRIRPAAMNAADHIRQRREADHLCDVCSRAGSGGSAGGCAFSFRVVAN